MTPSTSLLPNAPLASTNNDLRWIAQSLRKHLVLATAVTLTVWGAVAAYTFTRTPVYESETLILTANQTAVSVVQALDSAANPDVETEIQILKSPSLLAKAIQNFPARYRDISTSQLVGNLTIIPVKDAGVLKVTYQDTDPQRAQAVLTALGNTYVAYSLDSKRSQATKALQFIGAQLPVAKQRLDQSANGIREFRKRYNLLDPDSYAASTAAGLLTLNQRIQDLHIILKQGQRQYTELQRQIGTDSDTARANTILSQDQNYQKLISQYREAATLYATERLRFKDASPNLQVLKARQDEYLYLLQEHSRNILGKRAIVLPPIPSLNPSLPSTALNLPATVTPSVPNIPEYQPLQQTLTTDMLSAKTNLEGQTAQLKALQQAAQEQTQRFAQIPALQQQYTELQRQFTVNSASLNSLLTKFQELRIAEAQETSAWRVLEPPYRPDLPIFPKIPQNLLYGLLMGLLLGGGAALLRARLDNRVQNAQEAKELTNLPVLGVLPKFDQVVRILGESSTLAQRQNRSVFKAALYSLALNLQQIEGAKSFLVTSSLPGEGKSTITYNLGLILAELGQRVLVVDTDMSRPSLHVFAQTPNHVGLSTLFLHDQHWQNLVQKGETANLTLLTSGPMPADPVVLLTSEKMTQLLTQWQHHYDYILLDAPPIVGLPEVQGLASKVDRVLLVLAIERSVRSLIANALEVIRSSRGKLAGVVLNMLGKEDKFYYYHYHEASRYNTEPQPAEEIVPKLN